MSSEIERHVFLRERKRTEATLRQAARRSDNILESITDLVVAFDHEWRYTYVNRRSLDRMRQARGKDLALDDVVGRRLWDLFPELVGTTTDHQLHRAVREQTTVVFESYSPATDDWLEVHAYPSKEGGLSVFARDVTEPVKAKRELESRARRQAAIAELGLKALRDGRLEPLLDEAVTLVCRTLGLEYAKVEELLPAGAGLLVRAGMGWGEGVVGTCVTPPGRHSPAGYALLVAEPVIVDDMTAETRFEVPAVLREHGVMSGVTVVIDPNTQPFGTLAALSTKRRTFSEDEVSFVQSVADVLATRVVRSEIDEQLEAAREAERSRMARDLHDEALSGLADAIVSARLVEASASEAETAERVERLVPTLTGVGEQLRAAIYDLRLPEEQQKPFPELLESLVDLHRRRAGDSDIELDVRADGVGSLGPKGTQLLRIVGEALTNARRHSAAKTITVLARVWSETLVIEVSDDGRGFDSSVGTSSDETGMRGMQERAAVAGAELTIDSEAGVGTLVRVEFPLVPE
jgi:signal transduction histidine kinase